MSDKLTQEKELLREIATRPPIGKSIGYIKLTGPGLLQSAMTLGAGSAAASVVAGASFGYKLLWVQPVAMFLGIMMFVALSNIVLTVKERPYWSFMGEARKIWGPLVLLVFFWALGAVVASIIWHFPQYGLAAGAVRSIVQEFSPDAVLQTEVGYTTLGYCVSFGAGLIILLINMLVVFNYGRGGVGIRVYEWFLRCMIGLVFLTFLLVVILNFNKIDFVEMGKGFIGWYGIPYNEDPEQYFNTIILVMGMLGAAVGINMTFMYPYSLLKKNWGTEHKTLAKWDLAMTMFIPFTVITSLIMLGMTVSGIYDGGDVINRAISPLQAAAALEGGFIPQRVATIIFCAGLVGMTFGAISAHMTCCGFVLNEMFGLEPTTWRFRLFALAPSIGILGVVFQLPFWFPVFASAICFTMLPIAYLIFLVLNNRRSYIGNAVGKGLKRAVFNTLLVLALLMATIGASIMIKMRVVDSLFPAPPPPSVQQIEEESEASS
ncbi:MAG: divalent metal cation transporter [Planctomycetaceae bacterium]|nr:divalent metal cation transporter [Planctomycetaceae bacterium]